MWGLFHLRTLSGGHSKLSIVANWLRLLVTYRRSARLVIEPSSTACIPASQPGLASAERIAPL
jgi:NADH:ubiquinone reductase (H+-translocating)